jgi:Dyp-type peroxidase family
MAHETSPEAESWTERVRRLLLKREAPRAPEAALSLDLADMQGLVAHGYAHMHAACFLLLHIDRERLGAFKAWLGQQLPDLTSSRFRKDASRDPYSLNLAFTAAGLEALGLGPELKTFPYEFRKGMASRAQHLGDLDADAPEHWDFGGPGMPRPAHLMLMLYARTRQRLEPLVARHRARLEEGGLSEVHAEWGAHMQDDKGYFLEHFGFRDALSQPRIRGITELNPPPAHADYDAPIEPGEFILGYPNEYGEEPSSPWVPRERDVGDWLHPVHTAADGLDRSRKDLGRNGSFLVMRKLEQHVEDFHAFFRDYVRAHPDVVPGPTEEARAEWLEAKLMGRWKNGDPLRPGEDTPLADDGIIPNDFLFIGKDARHPVDAYGYGCPVTSHVRRANPRDSLHPNPELSLKMSRRHRLLRRGMPYVERKEGQEHKGLLFLALNTDLARQFEFIQRSWVGSGKFGDLYDERDPVAGGPGKMTVPREPVRLCIPDLKRFVTVKGGEYFFLPGLRALEFLADLP